MSKFNIVEKAGSSLMHISKCLDDPEKIVSSLKDKEWKEDRADEGKIGPFCFIREPEREYYQILDSFMQAAEIFLSSTNRDIVDYEKTNKFHTDKEVVVKQHNPISKVYGLGFEANQDLTDIKIFKPQSNSFAIISDTTGL